MPDVDLIAIRDFSYATRRLKAGDPFTVPAPMARVLVGIGKAEQPRVPGTVAPPPAKVVEAAKAAAPARASRPVRAVTTQSAKKPARRRRSTAKKG